MSVNIRGGRSSRGRGEVRCTVSPLPLPSLNPRLSILPLKKYNIKDIRPPDINECKDVSSPFLFYQKIINTLL